MKTVGRNVWIALAMLTVASLVMAQAETTSKSTSAATDAVKTAKAMKEAEAYPLDHCIVTGEKLGSMGDPVIKVYDGREVRFCCGGCVKTFERDKVKWTKKLDDAIIAAQKPSYPLNTCVVSGDTLGRMGEPVDYVFGNRLVQLCRRECVSTFNKDPERYLEMINAASKPANADGTPSETPHH
jgi:YHS domain-containing protein